MTTNCAKCGGAIGMDSVDKTDSQYIEHHSCINGHTGRVRYGKTDNLENWDWKGPVFQG